MRKLVALALVVAASLALPPCPALACSLCSMIQSQPTLRQELEDAKLVLLGTTSNPRANGDGTGMTDFAVRKVLADRDRWLGDRRAVVLNRVVLDTDINTYVVFGNIRDGKLDAYRGLPVRSPALLTYLEGAQALKGTDRTKALLYYFRFVDHEDKDIASDAFLEFARSTDQEVGAVARHLPADRLRKLLQDPKTPVERLSLYAFLLGATGGDQDAALLHRMITQPTARTANALDGLLCGYISLRPREGWDLVVALLSDRKRGFNERFSVSRTLKFFQAWKPEETKAQVLRGWAVMLQDGDLCDLAVEDLRRAKAWDLTAHVLAQYGKPTHAAPIIRRGIVRYALSCPLPEARQFVEQVRRTDGETVRELEEALQFENRP
jgi:hypothetical protein